MLIHDVARFFDHDPLTDGYSGAALFSGQVSSYNDATSDGATLRRRILSLAPGLSIPARRVVSLYGDRWLVGTNVPDGFLGETIRQNFTMKLATDSMTVRTPAQALAASGGTAAYVHKSYFKDMVESQTDTDYDTFWNIFIAPSESADKGTFLVDDTSRLYRVRNSYLPAEGLRVLQCDSLEWVARTTIVVNTGTLDRSTGLVGAGTTTFNAIRLGVDQLARSEHVSSPKPTAGDVTLIVPTSSSISVGRTFTMASATWRIEAKQAEVDASVIQACRA